MPVEFNDEALDGAKAGVKRLIAGTFGYDKNGKINEDYVSQFKDAMDEDLNTSKAFAVLFSVLKEGDKNTLAYLASALGFDLTPPKAELTFEMLSPVYDIFELDKTLSADDAMNKIIEIRKKAREENWNY